MAGVIRIGIGIVGVIGVILLGGCQGTSWGERFAQQVGYGTPLPVPTPVPTMVMPVSPSQPLAPTPLPPALTTPGDPDTTSTAHVFPEFTDLDTAPFAREAIADLANLGVWQGIPGPRFEPGLSVRRREFARWLVLANNALSGDTPTRLIRLSGSLQRPLFLDVPEDDPDFEVIQTLGSLGIIRGDHRQEFRPNSLLTRADLIAMKVPLDLPPGGLSGSLGELQQAWGFSDSEQIPSYAWPALIGDRQLGEESNVLRVFGVIRTFNAQNPVSRAEVALALSRFHNPLRTPAQVLSTPTPAPSPIPIPTPMTDLSPLPIFSPTPSPTPSPSLPSPPAGRFVQP